VVKLSHLKISVRLPAALALLLALLLAIVAVALVQLGALQSKSQEMATTWLPAVEVANRMSASTSNFRIAEFQHVLDYQLQRKAKIEELLSALMGEFDKDSKQLGNLLENPQERKLLETTLGEWSRYLAVHEQVRAISRNNDSEKAKALLEGDARTLFESANASLKQLVVLTSKGADAAATEADATYTKARNTLLTATIVAALLAILAAVWLVRSITHPLRDATTAADRVASGDLSGSWSEPAPDEIGAVLKSLRQMQLRLAQVVANVRQNAEMVASASAQISQGNMDLSGRTELQANALQETAATMAELGDTVSLNAKNADSANRLAKEATAIATEGGAVVQKVVTTMQSIDASSRKIGDIVAVIDGIAFQTNILALNAAVEAAQAGDHGRGFAVVAGEVRALAQRSAEAAKEIKGLIARSTDQVTQGTALVAQAGSTMTEIVTSIQSVGDKVDKIASASMEQSHSVQRVSESIRQLDQSTQRNTALVEESAAAAESLRSQAERLVAAVAVFQLPQASDVDTAQLDQAVQDAETGEHFVENSAGFDHVGTHRNE
jgi:methyl-accepting chemotaxis protein